jgi:hypothetical protein
MHDREKSHTLVLNGVAIQFITKFGMTRIRSHATTDPGRLEPLIDAIRKLQTKEDEEGTRCINEAENKANSFDG